MLIYYILGLYIYYTLRALTVLSSLQWSSAYQGLCGRLCISGLPGSDQAWRNESGYVWMGSSCCKPAVQELQDAGPHHWHWIPSVHWLFLTPFCPVLPPLLIFSILISAYPHFLFRLSYHLIDGYRLIRFLFILTKCLLCISTHAVQDPDEEALLKSR